jgi:hypothetical protein
MSGSSARSTVSAETTNVVPGETQSTQGERNRMNQKQFSELDRGIVDAYFADIFDAYVACGKLYKKSTNPEVKRAAKRIKHAMDLGLNKLTLLGIHSENRFAKLRSEWPDFSIQSRSGEAFT